MRLLHTADWHLGITLNGWSREAEHAAFLASLGDIIEARAVDALLIAGDVFDGLNPSAAAQRMLYDALAGFRRRRRGLQVVMIAGNHDPGARIEAPAGMLADLGLHVLGRLHWRDGAVDMARHLVPLGQGIDTCSGAPRAFVLAVPFLRAADLPGLTLAGGDGGKGGGEDGGDGGVVAATRQLHLAMAAQATALAGSVPLIAMGHLHCAGGLESEGAERRILIGGEHAVPPDIYPPGLAYVALGHLHRPQSLDGGRVRYAGSPFPLSATEIGYDHGVTLLDLGPDGVETSHLPLPRPAPFLRLPATGALAAEALAPALARALTGLPGPAPAPRSAAAEGDQAQGAARPHTGSGAVSDTCAAPDPAPGPSPALRPDPGRGTTTPADRARATDPHRPRGQGPAPDRVPSSPPGTAQTDLAPLVQLVVAADRPVPALLAAVDAALAQHCLRLAGLRLERPASAEADLPTRQDAPRGLDETTPEALFRQAFREVHGVEPDHAHLAAFRDALAEV